MSDIPTTAIVIAVGPGKDRTLDTLDSVHQHCPEPHLVVIVDDCTSDGTYETLCAWKRPNWRVLRNRRPMGLERLTHSLGMGYGYVLAESACEVVLKLDQDALLIKPGVLTDALDYAQSHPAVGIFGVYERDYNRQRNFRTHRETITRELGLLRRFLGMGPAWAKWLRLAEQRGYQRGSNVFGGAYFLTRPCLAGMKRLGALDLPYHWHSQLAEDAYFSIAAVAAGFEMGHFAAPDGPLCLEWQGLPYPAKALAESPYKLIHSVDKGQYTEASTNDGLSAREVFRNLRREAQPSLSHRASIAS